MNKFIILFFTVFLFTASAFSSPTWVRESVIQKNLNVTLKVRQSKLNLNNLFTLPVGTRIEKVFVIATSRGGKGELALFHGGYEVETKIIGRHLSVAEFDLYEVIEADEGFFLKLFGLEGEVHVASIGIVIRGKIDPRTTAEIPGYQGVCHIDNDKSFDYDQNIVGIVKGETVDDLIRNCWVIAKTTYGKGASFGLKYVKNDGVIPKNILVGKCWGDDDSTFNPNIFYLGNVFGKEASSLSYQCHKMVKATWGENSSSGLSEIKVN